jgi:hypothetical protein
MYHDDLAMMHQLLLEEEEDLAEEELETQAAVCGALVLYGAEEAHRLRVERRHHCRTYLIRAQLLPNPRIATPWQVLYESQNDRAFITTMGFNVATFHRILKDGFKSRWNSTSIPRRDIQNTYAPRIGRRSLNAAGALGLVLHFLSSTMLDISLVQIFALVPSTVSRYINFSLTILLETLRNMPDASIKWLIGDEFQENNNLVVERHPLLTGAFGSMDGLNLPVQTSADQEVENATYNGWLHEHFVSCVFAFGATGACSLLISMFGLTAGCFRCHHWM